MLLLHHPVTVDEGFTMNVPAVGRFTVKGVGIIERVHNILQLRRSTRLVCEVR